MKLIAFIILFFSVSAAMAQTPPTPWTHAGAMAAEQRMAGAYAAQLDALKAKMPDQAAVLEAKKQQFLEAEHRRMIGQIFRASPVSKNPVEAAHNIARLAPNTADVRGAAQTHGIPVPAVADPETFMRGVK